MPLSDIVVGQELPQDPAYAEDNTARKFWRLSYQCGRHYAQGLDSLGNPILIKHEAEKDDTYKRRQRLTKPRNHVGPIARRYNDFVFRQEAERDAAEGVYAELRADADGQGTPLPAFMRRSLLMAQIDRECYLLPDSNKPGDAGEMTKAQADEAGYRPLLRRITADSVVWSKDTNGMMTEAIVLMDADGGKFARWYGPESYCDIQLKKNADIVNPHNMFVDSVGDEVAHTYVGCPLVRLRPLFDLNDFGGGESMIAPLSELQQSIFNMQALLGEELFNVTFSQVVATGVSADEVKDVVTGNTRLICLPRPGSDFKVIGADPAQAVSIRQSIEDEQRELYRIAGVSTGDPTAGPGNAESGVAKAFRFNDLAANLSALADACEEAENLVIDRLFTGMGAEPPEHASYGDNFELPDIGAEITLLIQGITTSAMPQVIKHSMVRQFADRNLNLDEDERKQLDVELDDMAKQSELMAQVQQVGTPPPAFSPVPKAAGQSQK